jgi:precorrin-2 dehydrogenase/sirohydrochlorin ferrochelatase
MHNPSRARPSTGYSVHVGFMVNLALEGRLALVVGAGEVASRKIQDLLAARADVSVVALRACDSVHSLAQEGRIRLALKPYAAEDLGGAFLVVAATGDEDLNARVATDARAAGVLVNVVDRPALCSFTVPATVHRGDLTIAVSTEGRCPALASVLREELEGRYGPAYSALVELFGELRSRMIAIAWDGRKIRDTLARIYHDGVLERIAGRDREALRSFLQARLGSEFPLPK